MDSPFCSLSPLLQHDDETLLENTIFSNTYPELQIPKPGNTNIPNFGCISAVSSQCVEANYDKEKKLQTNGDEKKSRKNCVEKKIMHRDIERQRRQEMAALYSSLRSVLPPRQLKGKRSISDQLHEAAKFIQIMQKRISELGAKRDNLKKLHSENGSCKNPSPVLVRVQPCGVGVEVLITAETLIDINLSRITRMLHEEGLLVVSYNCTTTDGRLIYIIQSEVSVDCSGVDLNMLQRNISYMVDSFI